MSKHSKYVKMRKRAKFQPSKEVYEHRQTIRNMLNIYKSFEVIDKVSKHRPITDGKMFRYFRANLREVYCVQTIPIGLLRS